MVFFHLSPHRGLNNAAKSLILCSALYMFMHIFVTWNNAIRDSGSSVAPRPVVTHKAPAALSYTSRYLRINEYLFTGVDAKTYVASSTNNNNNARHRITLYACENA